MNGLRGTNINNQRYKIPAIPWIILIALILITSCSIKKETDVLFDHAVIATVNGEPVSTQLFQQRYLLIELLFTVISIKNTGSAIPLTFGQQNMARKYHQK